MFALTSHRYSMLQSYRYCILSSTIYRYTDEPYATKPDRSSMQWGHLLPTGGTVKGMMKSQHTVKSVAQCQKTKSEVKVLCLSVAQ